MFFSWLSRFTDATEGKIYTWLHQAPDQAKMILAPQAEAWLQRDTARVMLLLEWKFKGYKHLTKRRRRRCYHNLEALKADFSDFLTRHPAPTAEAHLERINQYLHPSRVQYRRGSSFDKLCVNPKQAQLVGDCNQLVALYVYLFALKYQVQDLQLKLLPEHVCLHYQNTDYETTSGLVTRYQKFTRLVPIAELLALNLQDIADKHRQHPLPPENRLLCARLALMFTRDTKLARHNIKAAKQKLLHQALEQKQWRQARHWAQSLKDPKLSRLVLEHEGFAALKQKSFTKARRLFAQAGSKRGQLAADQAELVRVVEKLQRYKTTAQLRAHRAVIRRALSLAKRAERPKVVRWCEQVLKAL